MASHEEDLQALQTELKRLGLRIADLPGAGLAAASGAAFEQFLARLRTMAPGVTWRDVLPELPAHWESGRPETWTTPYRPFGSYDYQELPTGPAVHVVWDRDGAPALEQLVGAARQVGWPVYGAGFIQPPLHAMIVLERGTTEGQTGSFVEWLNEQSGLRVATIPRTGRETYLP